MIKKKIKILQVCYSLKAAGIESFAANLQQNINTENYEVHFLVYKNSVFDMFYKDKIVNNYGEIKDASTSSINNFLLRHVMQRINYCKFLRTEKYDVVHIHASSGLQGLEVIIAHLMGVKNIITHSHSSNLSAASKFNGLKWLIHKYGIKVIGKYSKFELACSAESAEWLFPMPRNVLIILNGIQCKDYKFSNSMRYMVRKKFEIDDDELVIGHIGTFSEIKNHLFLIKVFNAIHKKKSKSKLVLIGEGHLKNEVIKDVHSLGLQDNVLFLGVRNDCNEILMAMDYFVFPSLWEGFPITLVEAQASGLPCIVSDTITTQAALCGNIKFVSLKAGAEYWCETVITQPLAQNRCMYSELVSKRGFDMEVTAQKIEYIYNELVGEGYVHKIG